MPGSSAAGLHQARRAQHLEQRHWVDGRRDDLPGGRELRAPAHAEDGLVRHRRRRCARPRADAPGSRQPAEDRREPQQAREPGRRRVLRRRRGGAEAAVRAHGPQPDLHPGGLSGDRQHDAGVRDPRRGEHLGQRDRPARGAADRGGHRAQQDPDHVPRGDGPHGGALRRVPGPRSRGDAGPAGHDPEQEPRGRRGPRHDRRVPQHRAHQPRPLVLLSDGRGAGHAPEPRLAVAEPADPGPLAQRPRGPRRCRHRAEHRRPRVRAPAASRDGLLQPRCQRPDDVQGCTGGAGSRA
mmetsp:Transcript_13629/g.39784  ORF Transcript_13629/g.39784 Transcript_13629/m.39784 type:complete len:295 (-) Transcript_13629:276-1160(-)